MRLYFLRHGLADRNEWNGPDFDRPLTERGRRRMAAEAETLARLELTFDAVITSPLARARQTAGIVAARLNLDRSLTVDDRLAPGFGPKALSGVLADHAESSRLLLVGHEPDFSWTVGALVGGGEVVCKKGSLARVDLSSLVPPRGELVWLLPPRLLALEAVGD